MDSGEGKTGESLTFVGVVGVVTTASGGGIGFRLNFADGPRRSRILADDVLGEVDADDSGNDGMDDIFDMGGLRRFAGIERFGNDGECVGRGPLNDGIRLFVDAGVVVDGSGELRFNDGEISEAGTGGGGGCIAAAKGLENTRITYNFIGMKDIRRNLTLNYTLLLFVFGR